jgi:hypothetical protein
VSTPSSRGRSALFYFSWHNSAGTIHAAEVGNVTFAICGEPLQEFSSDLNSPQWKGKNAPDDLCDACQAKVV